MSNGTYGIKRLRYLLLKQLARQKNLKPKSYVFFIFQRAVWTGDLSTVVVCPHWVHVVVVWFPEKFDCINIVATDQNLNILCFFCCFKLCQLTSDPATCCDQGQYCEGIAWTQLVPSWVFCFIVSFWSQFFDVLSIPLWHYLDGCCYYIHQLHLLLCENWKKAPWTSALILAFCISLRGSGPHFLICIMIRNSLIDEVIWEDKRQVVPAELLLSLIPAHHLPMSDQQSDVHLGDEIM